MTQNLPKIQPEHGAEIGSTCTDIGRERGVRRAGKGLTKQISRFEFGQEGTRPGVFLPLYIGAPFQQNPDPAMGLLRAQQQRILGILPPLGTSWVKSGESAFDSMP